jgi:hypothetical protein
MDGAKSEGKLLGVENGQISLLIDGREYLFPINRFSLSDQEFVKKWRSQKRCGTCYEEIVGEKMKAGENEYHPKCFTCLVCERPFLDRESIRKDEWGGMVHAQHFHQALSCGSCGRLLSKKTSQPQQFFPDGRVCCLSCLRDGVTDLAKLRAVAKRVRLGMSELGLPEPRGPLSLRLVDQKSLNIEAERIHGRGSLRGLTSTTFRTVRGGANAGTTYSHQVMVLTALPVVECVSVLAHEFGHVWLNENFIDASPPAVEGFCNLLSMHLLRKETSKLAEILRRNLQMSEDYVYGRGFREMKKKLDQLGWPALIRDLYSRRVHPSKRKLK